MTNDQIVLRLVKSIPEPDSPKYESGGDPGISYTAPSPVAAKPAVPPPPPGSRRQA